MKIEFENVLPAPLKNEIHSNESVWNSCFELHHQYNYILNASSGKGKSTFSNILYGLRHDYSGKIMFDGNLISTFSMNEWSDYRIGKIAAVFQSLDLFSELTVLDNIMIKNRLTDFKTEKEILATLEFLGIDNLKNNLVGNLSMGQQQRVAIVRALCQPFKWLLLDEPFSHLDEANIKKALTVIQNEVKNSQAGMILTTLGSDHGIKDYQKLFL